MKRYQRVSAALISTLFTTFAFVAPAPATGSTQDSLSNPIVAELIADMGYTASQFAVDSHNLSISGRNISYQNDVPNEMATDRVDVGTSASRIQVLQYNWVPETNSWGSVNRTVRFGYSNGTNYASINSIADSAGLEALKRLKKTNAKWAIKKTSVDGIQVGVFTPSLLRLQIATSTLLTSVSSLTMQGTATITDAVVTRNTPVGSDTFTLTSTNSDLVFYFTFIVGNNREIQSVQQNQMQVVDNHSTQLSHQEVTIIDRTSSQPIQSYMGAKDATVDYSMLYAMRARIVSERGITPQAVAVATRAKVLASAAKGKGKNVVTAKLIQKATKALHQVAAITKTGVKLTGPVSGQDFKGYMCVSAVKKKAVVASC